MLEKKYYSIAETSKSTNLPLHKLRYIEKTDKKVDIVQIRGRRYFTKKDIAYINSAYTKTNASSGFEASETIKPHINTTHDTQMVSQIDQLIYKLNKIKEYS